MPATPVVYAVRGWPFGDDEIDSRVFQQRRRSLLIVLVPIFARACLLLELYADHAARRSLVGQLRPLGRFIDQGWRKRKAPDPDEFSFA